MNPPFFIIFLARPRLVAPIRSPQAGSGCPVDGAPFHPSCGAHLPTHHADLTRLGEVLPNRLVTLADFVAI
jgi:hypothetical protein